MKLLIAALLLTLALAGTGAVFAIWPVVADAPWEADAQRAQPPVDRTKEIRCEGALRLREAVVNAGITRTSYGGPSSSPGSPGSGSVGGGRLTRSEYDRQLATAEREIARYC